MKFFTAATIAALVSYASAATTSVKLFIQAEDTEVNNKGLSHIHEGAAIDYIPLGDGAATVNYDDEKLSLYIQNAKFSQAFQLANEICEYAPSDPLDVEFEDDFLKIHGSTDGFYACKNINDPYQYLKNEYFLTYYGDDTAAAGCIEVKVHKVDQ